MNAMANKTEVSLESLQYFVVPASWFTKAWPLLTTRSPDGIQEEWRDQVGRIQNAELLDQNAQNAVSSSDEDDTNNSPERQKKRFEKLHLQMARNRQQSVMRSGLTHMKDYFFLGPSAWMLVEEKFGFDGHELGRSCVFTGTGNNVLAIQLQETEVEENQSRLIPIPASGRFAYEKIVPSESTSAITTDIVPEVEEDEGNASASVRAIQSYSYPCGA
jgi:hypothetical protein